MLARSADLPTDELDAVRTMFVSARGDVRGEDGVEGAAEKETRRLGWGAAVIARADRVERMQLRGLDTAWTL